MWSQITQVCTAGRHFRSLSINPCGALGKKTSIAAQPPSLFFPSSTPNFFPSCNIIHFNRPTPFPLSFPLKLVIKRLTRLLTKRVVFEMQTNKHLGFFFLRLHILLSCSGNICFKFTSSVCKCKSL